MGNPQNQQGPLSWQSILGGVIVTVIAGIILAFLIQDARFDPDRPSNTASLQTPQTNTLEPTLMSKPTVTNSASTPEPMSATIKPDETPTPINALTLDLKQNLQTTIPGFEATLVSINFTPSSGMQWNFEFWNKTGREQRVHISARESYVVDDIGNKYLMAKTYDETIAPGVRVQSSVTFDTVNSEATILTLYLLTISSSFVNFESPAIVINR